MKQEFPVLPPDDRKVIVRVVMWAIAVSCPLIVVPLLSMMGGDDSLFNKFVVGWQINTKLIMAVYVVLAVGVVAWIISGLRRGRKKSKNRAAETQISVALVFLFLQLPSPETCSATTQEVVSTQVVTVTMPCAPGQEGNVTITATNNPALLKTVAALGEEITLAQLEALMEIKGVTIVVGGSNSAKLTIVGCIIITIIIIVVIGGMVYVFVKIVKRCKEIEKKRKKQADDAEKSVVSRYSPTASTSGAESNSVVRTVIAASFIDGFAPQNGSDETGYETRPASFHYVVRAGGSISLVPNLGTTTMSADDYLAKHGLPPDLALTQDCFAVNGVATNTVPVVSYLNGFVFVDVPGASDRVVTAIERSMDLINWQTIKGFVTPAGTVISFGDGESSAAQSFYRVLVVQ